MAASQSVELATLVQCTEKLARGISQDPLVVATKLLEVGLVPPKLIATMLLPNKCDFKKAIDLLMQVMKIVQGFPQKFQGFMKILKDCCWLNDLVRMVSEQYEVAKKNQGEVIQVGEDTEEFKNLQREIDKLERIIFLKEEAEKSLLLEKQEVGREKNRLLRELDSKNEDMLKPLEVLKRWLEMEARLNKKI